MNNLIILFRELGTFNRDIFDKFQSILHQSYYFYHNNLEDCLTKKEPTLKRKVMYCLSFVIIIIHTIYSGILITYQDHETQALFGDPLFVFSTQYRFINGVWLCVSMIILSGKFTLLYFEMFSKTNAPKLLYDLYDGTDFYRLNEQNEEKILFSVNFFYWFGMRLLCYSIIFYATLIYSLFRIIAYFYFPYQFNIITSVWLTIQYTICVKIISTGSYGAITGYHILINFLIFKIDEIVNYIKIAVRWRNKNKLIDLIADYDKFNNVFHQINTPINIILGVCYMTMPYMASNMLKIMDWNTESVIDLFLKLVTIGIFCGAILAILRANFFNNKLIMKNNSIPRYFYRFISNSNLHFKRNSQLTSSLKQINHIRFIMKIQLFIARFRYGLVGFRIFNLISFTIKFIKFYGRM